MNIRTVTEWAGRVFFAAMVCTAPTLAQSLRFDGERIRADAMPETVPESARLAIEAWRGFAEQHGYTLWLDANGHVLLLSPDDDKKGGRRANLIKKSLSRFDDSVPLPELSAGVIDAQAKVAAPDAVVLPDDPDGKWEDPFADDLEPEVEAEPEESGPVAWGAGKKHVPDSETAVIVALRGRDDLGLLLRDLVRRYPLLSDWAPKTSGQAGFALQFPLVAASLISQPDLEEWEPMNELVNRVYQLLLRRRFGTQPNWVVQGVAWDGEMAHMESVYCFPHREGFVAANEHTGWKLDVRYRIERLERDLEGDDFMHWERGTYVDRYARYSWAVMHYLSKERPQDLARYLEGLRLFAEENNRRETEDGGWERIPDYKIPLTVQQELLKEIFGASIWNDVSNHYSG